MKQQMEESKRNIEILRQTRAILAGEAYDSTGGKVRLLLTQQEMKQAQVFLQEDVDRIRLASAARGPVKPENCEFTCTNKDSFSAALERIRISGLGKRERVLVLNFANAFTPGGGVRSGARAQEETLCRRSSLLLSLESEAAEIYYDYNYQLGSDLATDGIIISPDVEVFRDEANELLPQTALVAVMTCAAPDLRAQEERAGTEGIRTVMRQRIESILATAAALGYRHLVLGAFGCGAFKNDPKVVSNLFREALEAFCPFDTVDFAVLANEHSMKNYEEFSRNFSDFYSSAALKSAR